MKWVCNCYGSTEARSFPGSIITLPSFDEKTIILDFRQRTINLVLTHPSTCLSPFVRLLRRKEKKRLWEKRLTPLKLHGILTSLGFSRIFWWAAADKACGEGEAETKATRMTDMTTRRRRPRWIPRVELIVGMTDNE